MKILVTGGAGFIGANLVRLLIKQNHQVTVVDNLSAGSLDKLAGLDITFHQGDVREQGWHALLEKVDSVVHLAAQTGVPSSIRDPEHDAQVNVLGTLRTLQGCAKAGVHRFIFASSNAPVGEQKPPVNERSVPHPLSPYGASKLAGEGYCNAFYASFNMETVVLRFANVYGPFSDHKTSVVAKFFKLLLNGQPLPIYGNGHQTRDIVYVSDLCQAILLALTVDGIGGQIFQIGTGQATSVLDLIAALEKVTGQSFKVVYEPPRIGDMQHNYCDISKAQQLLGYEPKISLSEGLKHTYAALVKSFNITV